MCGDVKGDEDGNVDEESCGELVWGMGGKENGNVIKRGSKRGWGWGLRGREGREYEKISLQILITNLLMLLETILLIIISLLA